MNNQKPNKDNLMLSSHFVQEFNRLNFQKQVDLLRAVLERKLDFIDLVTCNTAKDMQSLMTANEVWLDSVKEFNDFSDRIRVTFYDGDTNEEKIVKKYKALPIKERIAQRIQYTGTLPQSRALQKIIKQDYGVISVAYLLVRLFANNVYANVESTDEQVSILKLLTLTPPANAHENLLANRYWFFYDILSHSNFYGDLDRKQFFIKQVGLILDMEITLTASLNKTIHFLEEIKATVDDLRWNKARGVFDKHCPGFITTFRNILSELPKERKTQDDMTVYARLFNQVNESLSVDPKDFGIMPSKDKKEFYEVWSRRARIVLDNEGKRLEAASASRFALVNR